jgi:hypothetical protein
LVLLLLFPGGTTAGAGSKDLETASTAAVTEGRKLAVNEQAPDGADRSFPSGHASIVFSGAAFVQMRYGWTYGIPACLVAAFVAGAAIGILAHGTFTSPYRAVTVVPAVRRDSIGVVVTRCF